MSAPDWVVEVDYANHPKAGQHISGDVCLCRRVGERVVVIVADGLGSGVEAATLASLTAAMSLEYVLNDLELLRSAERVMDALPIDPERQISYAAFTLVDVGPDGVVEIISHANPAVLLVRHGCLTAITCTPLHQPRWRARFLSYARLLVEPGDELLIPSDGITQAGLGTAAFPLGWGEGGLRRFVESLSPSLSARALAEALVSEAERLDGGALGDDATCAVLSFRRPRRLMVFSGPPFDDAQDRPCALRLASFPGTKVVCGGTTANIVARELSLEVHMDLTALDREIPATSDMVGLDLVTEGMITLGKAAAWLESREIPERRNGATRLALCLRDHDEIEFLVGTRVNEAHQDPSLPVELDIRRNVIKRIARTLEEIYLKTVKVSYV